jgi:hypothetical protein
MLDYLTAALQPSCISQWGLVGSAKLCSSQSSVLQPPGLAMVPAAVAMLPLLVLLLQLGLPWITSVWVSDGLLLVLVDHVAARIQLSCIHSQRGRRVCSC